MTTTYRLVRGASVDKVAEEQRLKIIIKHVCRSRAAEACGLNSSSLQQWLRVGDRLERARVLAEAHIKRVRKTWMRKYPKLTYQEVSEMFSACRTPWVITYAIKRQRELTRKGVL